MVILRIEKARNPCYNIDTTKERKRKGERKMEREIVKIVNGYAITKTPNTRRFYYVYLTEHKFCTFHTIKAATAFCESL